MRNLTHYELRVLIKNEVEILNKYVREENGFNIDYIKGRAFDIMQYAKEFKDLEESEI